MSVNIFNLKIHILPWILREKCVFLRNFSVKKSYKVLFFGSESIALSSLKKINEFRYKEQTICRLDLVTANASKNLSQIEKYAQTENITKVLWPLEDLIENEYDIGLIVAFGHLIKEDVLKKFPMGMVNVHPSLLPRWRGAAPIIHTLLHGDTVTGVTLMKIKADVFDVGAIVSQQQVSVSKNIKLPELTEQLSEIGAQMLVDCMRKLPHSLDNLQPQSLEGVTYANKIRRTISEVRWSEMSSVQVYNLYRAIYGLYALTTKFRDKQMKLFDAFIEDISEVEHVNKSPGTLEYCKERHAIRILCKDKKYIYFKSLRIIGKRKISAVDFYNGYIKNVPVEERNYVVC